MSQPLLPWLWLGAAGRRRWTLRMLIYVVLVVTVLLWVDHATAPKPCNEIAICIVRRAHRGCALGPCEVERAHRADVFHRAIGVLVVVPAIDALRWFRTHWSTRSFGSATT